MYHVSAQGVDERMINVHYYYYNKYSSSPVRSMFGELTVHPIENGEYVSGRTT